MYEFKNSYNSNIRLSSAIHMFTFVTGIEHKGAQIHPTRKLFCQRSLSFKALGYVLAFSLNLLSRPDMNPWRWLIVVDTRIKPPNFDSLL